MPIVTEETVVGEETKDEVKDLFAEIETVDLDTLRQFEDDLREERHILVKEHDTLRDRIDLINAKMEYTRMLRNHLGDIPF